jgi:hypothetical protein
VPERPWFLTGVAALFFIMVNCVYAFAPATIIIKPTIKNIFFI